MQDPGIDCHDVNHASYVISLNEIPNSSLVQMFVTFFTLLFILGYGK